MNMDTLQPFPVARFIHYGNFRYYYAFGNTPAEDFLESINEIKEPAVLLLGCGDIRSCFYTLWKNFVPQHKRHFSGVHFVLNDYSAAVLARNIMFLYLCIQIPKEKEDMKRWVAALWSIWYCHELLPDHKHILRDALTNLLRWSGSNDSWSKDSANPLRNIVKFASPCTLYEIQEVWKMWLHETISIKSVEEMRSARKEVIDSNLGDHSNAVILLKSFGELVSDIPINHWKRIEEELSTYFQCGCAFAENVLQLPFMSTKTLLNLTFFERADGLYTLHYGLTPYVCFFQTFQFSLEQLRKNNVTIFTLNNLVVEDQQFADHPLLANSVQQFTIWLSTSAKLLLQCLPKEKPNISFTLQCSDALKFCQQMRHDPKTFTNHLGFEPFFDVIHSSNLSDHVGPPNLVLTAVPLLKENSKLFTTTLLYRDVDVAAEKYLEATFGFEPMLLPLLCGVRCIGHEGNYSSSVSIQSTPKDGTSALYPIMGCTKLLIWQQVSMLPLKVTVLDKDSSVLKALTDSVVKVLTSYFNTSLGRRVITMLCMETVFHILLSFVSRMDTEVDINDYQYWKPFCSLLSDQQQLKPFIISLQTHAILHGFHFHLTVSESNCPICTRKPVSDYIDQFSIILPSSNICVRTPTFTVFIHKLPHHVVPDSLTLLAASSLGADVHIVDCVAGSHSKGSVKLDFFAPQFLATENYQITVSSMTGATMQQTVLMQRKLSDCRGPKAGCIYFFERLQTTLHTSKSMFGTMIQHFGDGDKMESILSLSERTMSALKLHKLDTKCISGAVIKVACADLGTEISYPYPVDYERTVIRLSRKNRKVTVIAPRRIQSIYEEKPTFTVMPDNTLSLPPMLISEEVTDIYCGLQFTMEDHAIRKQCSWLRPAEFNLKDSMIILFNYTKGNFLCLCYPDGSICGLLVIHNRVFDTQKKSPAIDLSFCFPDMPTFSCIAPHWQKAIPYEICRIRVDEAEFELMKKVFYHFARCTFTTSKKPYGRMPLLIKHKIDQYFTRAVVYPLYADQDVITEVLNKMHHLQPFSEEQCKTHQHVILPQFSSKVPQDESSSAISSLQNSQTFRGGGNETKCSCCGTPSHCLKKCSRCGKAQYCGQDCQKKHWKEHKVICSPQSAVHPNTQTHTTASVVRSQQKLEGDTAAKGGHKKCSFCGTQSDTLKKCSRCGKAQYCGQSCQKKHWKEHKLICFCCTQTESDFNYQTSKLQCTSNIAQNIDQNKCEGCEKEFSSLRMCQCHQVAYCSVECQRKDWQKHKDICTAKASRRHV